MKLKTWSGAASLLCFLTLIAANPAMAQSDEVATDYVQAAGRRVTDQAAA